MSISFHDVYDYMRLNFPNLSLIELTTRVENFKSEILRGNICKDNYFLVRDQEKNSLASSWIYEIEDKNYAFQAPKLQGKNSSAVQSLLSQVKQRFQKLDGRNLFCRTPYNKSYSLIKEEMLKAGFKITGDRVKYKALIKNLYFSSDSPSPLTWNAPLREKSMSIDELADFMEIVTKRDPGFDPESENTKKLIESYLADQSFYTQDDCIQVASFNNTSKLCSFVIAQVEKSSGWSRIAYMGIHPHFRGQGLGLWVQRHGIKMLRKQNGIEYYGGTSSSNDKMKAIFERNNCNVFRELTEWKLIKNVSF